MHHRPALSRPLPRSGPFPRAQGGWCEFRPALDPTEEPAAPDTSGEAVRTVYPRASPRPHLPERWVPVRG